MDHDQMVARVEQARRDPSLVLLEGLHPLKHALRFGARLDLVVVPPGVDLVAASRPFAPDLPDRLEIPVTRLPGPVFERLTAQRLTVPVLAVARRPPVAPADALAAQGDAPVVLLEEPAHLGNLGAVIRAAAAAGAAGVLSVGRADPWHPVAVRGAAGLQFALPVARLDELPATDRPLVLLDPDGVPLHATRVPPRALLAVGTERHGASPRLRAAADLAVSIPMTPGVSSLNLATAVAVALYALPGAGGHPGGALVCRTMQGNDTSYQEGA